MDLEYFKKIIANLDDIYSKKESNQEIICTINVNGAIYKGTYEPKCFDNKSTITLSKGYILPKDEYIIFTSNHKAYINIHKIDAITYFIKNNLPSL